MDDCLENYHYVDSHYKLESLIFLQVFLFLQPLHQFVFIHDMVMEKLYVYSRW